MGRLGADIEYGGDLGQGLARSPSPTDVVLLQGISQRPQAHDSHYADAWVFVFPDSEATVFDHKTVSDGVAQGEVMCTKGRRRSPLSSL